MYGNFTQLYEEPYETLRRHKKDDRLRIPGYYVNKLKTRFKIVKANKRLNISKEWRQREKTATQGLEISGSNAAGYKRTKGQKIFNNRRTVGKLAAKIVDLSDKNTAESRWYLSNQATIHENIYSVIIILSLYLFSCLVICNFNK